MDLLTYLMQAPDLAGDKASAVRFASDWRPQLFKKGTGIVQQGAQDTNEYILLAGCAVSCIFDAEGNTACVGLYIAPTVVTPNIARTRDRLSLVSLNATSDALIARMESDHLTDLMIGSEAIRNWANGVLREELGQKADREWCLAALGGSDRLAWFRERYPGYEDTFVHSMIASFLGITPVTMSRLRANSKTP